MVCVRCSRQQLWSCVLSKLHELRTCSIFTNFPNSVYIFPYSNIFIAREDHRVAFVSVTMRARLPAIVAWIQIGLHASANICNAITLGFLIYCSTKLHVTLDLGYASVCRLYIHHHISPSLVV